MDGHTFFGSVLRIVSEFACMLQEVLSQKKPQVQANVMQLGVLVEPRLWQGHPR